MFEVVFFLVLLYLVYFYFKDPKNLKNLPPFIKNLFIKENKKFQQFKDIYKNLTDLKEDLIKSGLESSNLIIGIDYTSSNLYQGRFTFDGKNLHTIDPKIQNPYEKVISIIGRTLEGLDEDNIIPVFGFGDITTKNEKVFRMVPEDKPYCEGFSDVLKVYRKMTPFIRLSGPTNFAPVINKAVELVCLNKKKEYHILLIIADGQVVDEDETVDAIIKASNFPLSIIVVGVGDGPWDEMEKYDDKIQGRRFDNFQFVDFHKIMKEKKNQDDQFALSALMEIPQQFRAIKKLKLL